MLLADKPNSFCVEKVLFILLSLSCAFIGFPSEMSIPFLVMYLVCFAGLFWYVAFPTIKCTLFEIRYVALILLYFLYCQVNFFIGYSNGFLAFDWLISMISVFSLFLTIALVFSNLKVDFVIKVVIFTSLIWSLKVFFEVLQHIPFSAILGIRITGVVIDSVMPYPLVAIILTLFYFCERNFIFYFLVLWFLIFIIMVGYKAVIALSAVAFIMFFFRKGIKISSLLIIMFTLFILLSLGLYEHVVTRFDSVGGSGDVIRLKEIEEALNLFYQSPSFGAGLGFSIPNSETVGHTKTYMHNSIIYLATSVGVVGFFIYLIILFSGVFNKSKINYITLTLILFLVSSITAASFKLFQFNYLLAVLLFLHLRRDEV